MRSLLVVAFMLLAGALVGNAQEAQRTPPGGDMLGSDRYLQRSDITTEPSPSPDQNQIMTNSGGASSGYENVPAFAGTSVNEGRTEQGSGGNSGLQGQTASTAGRLQAYSGSAVGAAPSKSVKQARRASPRKHAPATRRSGTTAARPPRPQH